MQTRDDIFYAVAEILVKEFEIEAADIKKTTHLYEDLDLDSIDAIDLVVKLKELTGKKIEPEGFKAVRTVDDVVNEIEKLIAN